MKDAQERVVFVEFLSVSNFWEFVVTICEVNGLDAIKGVRLVERGGYLGVMEQDKSILGEKKNTKVTKGHRGFG